MIPAIVIARGNSQGFPNKHTQDLNGLPVMSYPIIAANACKLVDETYFLSDSEKLRNQAKWYGAKTIEEPEELARSDSDTCDAYVYAYEGLSLYYADVHRVNLEFVVLLMGNAPCINSRMITEMIEKLREQKYFDSICTISEYNMFAPSRMRTKAGGGELENYLDDLGGRIIGVDCHRGSGGDYYIYDCSCAVVKPHCLENIKEGLLPQKWLGKSVMYYEQETPAIDIDFSWQMGQASYWISKHWGK